MVDRSRRRVAFVVGGLAVGPLLGCVEVSEWSPPTQLFEGVEMARTVAPEEDLPFVGVTLEESLGSLDEMEFLVGLEVVKVQPGSPAEGVGIEVGDRIVEADGVELLTLDQWPAVVESRDIGAELRLLVERDDGLSEVTLKIGRVGGEELPPATRFVERRKLRAELVTLVGDEGETTVVVERLLQGSPLLGKVAVGDRIITLNDQSIPSARFLIDRLADLDYGESVTLESSSATGDVEPPSTSLALWSPRRETTRVQIPILFDYERDLEQGVTSYQWIDLWLFSIYEYRRELESRRHRFLYFFEYSTGVGELAEIDEEESR